MRGSVRRNVRRSLDGGQVPHAQEDRSKQNVKWRRELHRTQNTVWGSNLSKYQQKRLRSDQAEQRHRNEVLLLNEGKSFKLRFHSDIFTDEVVRFVPGCHRSSQTNDATTFYIITLRQVNTPCGEAKRIALSQSPIYVDHIAFLYLPVQSYTANAVKEKDGEGERKILSGSGRGSFRSVVKGFLRFAISIVSHIGPLHTFFSVYSFYSARFYVPYALFIHLNSPRSCHPPLADFARNLLLLSVTNGRLFAPSDWIIYGRLWRWMISIDGTD